MTSQRAGSLVACAPRCDNVAELHLTERKPSEPDPDREIPYLRCGECDTPCYVFETSDGRVSEALCIACGNDSVTLFALGKWDDDEEG
jgi:hypothetical protein